MNSKSAVGFFSFFSYTNVDTFGGSGTTSKVANELGFDTVSY